MHTHIIRNPRHKAFLNENRSDPITGDEIKEGDKIVFCAICKSAFLYDTWLYLDKTHCNQGETLGKFPSSQKLEISGVTRPPLYVIGCNDKISNSYGNELLDETDNHFMNVPVIADERSLYQKNTFSIWVIIISVFLIILTMFLGIAPLSIGITFIAIMTIGIKSMFFKDKKLFTPSKKKKEIESIEIHRNYISIRFKDTKKDVRIILKSILTINLIYAGKSYSLQIVKKGNKIYEFSTSLSNVTQINQLLHSLVQLDEKVTIFVRNLPYDDRIKLRKWETENENILLY
ncbi:hypothetical protein Fleli_0711 [Bernardetia litoralis DSM 6794]|uniref:Uncharacterized protein n=1 Tax=Bernardetia litoralis (strain ATCC 23117 / DSM 6794 / NBRC 15988 / NCIMB 1366 / Fx l1 / Sio-4) TaxID=880071 RepID=I4AGT7_BERLS|nr:hypothetical protein [Bernardetia litoralis]AFM03172.1 hypothetical protein Fleli_0711 [Bernardetia litoralis DSM 6794]